MKEIYPDLWQTKLEIPFGSVHAHAYFLQRPEGNVLIYSTGHAEEVARIAEMGGIKYQYLSHRHEAGHRWRSSNDSSVRRCVATKRRDPRFQSRVK